jgi:hypothetical protein
MIVVEATHMRSASDDPKGIAYMMRLGWYSRYM